MSGRLCYLTRSDRGSRLVGVRMVGARSDEQWSVPQAAPVEGEPELFDDRVVSQAADWIRGRTVGEKSRSGELPLICLDADGYAAGWITSPTTERSVINTVTFSGVASDDVGSMVGPGLGFYLPSPREASVQGLSVATEPETKSDPRRTRDQRPEPKITPSTSDAQRIPVLVGADAPVRLLLDALDARSIHVAAVTTIWHAMARAWARPAQDAAQQQAVVADDSGVTAVVLVDIRGRLLWCWSAGGELLAGGSMRIVPATAVGRVPVPAPSDAARLTSDWMAWSAQLGVVPRRVVCIAADDPVGEGEERASFHAGQFGAKLTGSWPGAGVDLVLDVDPVGATLKRLAVLIADADPDERAIAGIEALTHRPGRVHRGAHTWVALGIAAAAVLAGGTAWQLRASAQALDSKVFETNEKWSETVRKAYPEIMKLPNVDVADELQKKLTRYEAERQRNSKEPTRPIIQELETLSLTLADPEVELESASFASGANSSLIVTVLVPDIKAGESVFKSISSIRGSNIESWSSSFTPSGAKVKGTFTGKWRAANAAKPATAPAAPTTKPQPAGNAGVSGDPKAGTAPATKPAEKAPEKAPGKAPDKPAGPKAGTP
ncbi:MAG: hypothetical protein K2Y21_11755 [Phycisphaerales bacterium]|nr:hypothetical protein [Phycisphaerales bacterium]